MQSTKWVILLQINIWNQKWGIDLRRAVDCNVEAENLQHYSLRLVKTIREWTGAECEVRKAKNWNWDGLVVEQFCHNITLRYYVTCPGVLQENDYCNYIWDFACLNGQLTRDSRESDACTIYTLVILEIVLTCWRPKRIVARTAVHVCTIICPDGLCGKSSAVGLHMFSLLSFSCFVCFIFFNIKNLGLL
jgi:hypothetical protein